MQCFTECGGIAYVTLTVADFNLFAVHVMRPEVRHYSYRDHTEHHRNEVTAIAEDWQIDLAVQYCDASVLE